MAIDVRANQVPSGRRGEAIVARDRDTGSQIVTTGIEDGIVSVMERHGARSGPLLVWAKLISAMAAEEANVPARVITARTATASRFPDECH